MRTILLEKLLGGFLLWRLIKLEICGVNTSKLPILSNEEKEELFRKDQTGG